MEIKKKLEEVRAKAKLLQLSGFKEVKHVDIPQIPRERTLFPGTKSDFWYAIDIPLLDITACVYELAKASVFMPHLHKVNTEQIFPITPDGKMEVITDKYIKTISYPNSVLFKRNEPHAIINKTDGTFVFIVVWSPKMEGWQGAFLPDYDVNMTSA